MPTTCCMLHRFGSGLGQNGSTRYCGALVASTACPVTTCACPTEAAAYTAMPHRQARTADTLVLVTTILLLWSGGASWPPARRRVVSHYYESERASVSTV